MLNLVVISLHKLHERLNMRIASFSFLPSEAQRQPTAHEGIVVGRPGAAMNLPSSESEEAPDDAMGLPSLQPPTQVFRQSPTMSGQPPLLLFGGSMGGSIRKLEFATFARRASIAQSTQA